MTFFSCVGTGVSGTSDLETIYPAAVRYLEAQRVPTAGRSERPLRYELAWLDNGGSEAARQAFLQQGAQIEHPLRNPTNEGLFRAVNDVWFRGRGCRAPYVLNLEDDREPHPHILAHGGVHGLQHLARAIRLLEEDEQLGGVRLKNEFSDGKIAAAAAAVLGRPVPWQRPRGGGGAGYQRHCMELSSGFVWGSFSMAAVLYDRERLQSRVGL